jgi:phosphotransferase system enzyme I (PtsI)
MEELKGLGVSPGLALGGAVCMETAADGVIRIPLEADAVEAEVGRLYEAVETTREELAVTRSKARQAVGEELASVFDAHALLLTDRALLERIERRIRDEQVNAEWAVHRSGEELGERFQAIEAPHLRERYEDLHDVTRYLLRCLQGLDHHHDISEVEGEVVIVAHDLTPSQAVRLGRGRVVGFAVETGGPTSHTAIIARALAVPLVAGLPGVVARVAQQTPVMIDGDRGVVVLDPSAEQIAGYHSALRRRDERDSDRAATRSLPCESLDGVRISLLANIELQEEIDQARRYGAEGVGLYRSEFLYIEHTPELPDEEEHLAIYRRLIETMSPYPVIVRTLDLGGRKLAREVLHTEEDNPVLGLRGIRLTMARPEIFRIQLRGLFRAGAHGPLSIMLPMVTTVAEVRQFRAFAGEILDELRREATPCCERYRLGVMIEVPSAALTADAMVREVDFVSIGTNDLIQYALAVDRNNEHVSHLYRPLHPAILRMIRFVLDAAGAAGVEVSLCGEMGSDAGAAALLVGMGLRRISLSPRMIPEVKTRIRRMNVAQMARIAEDCLGCGTAEEVEEVLREASQGAGPSE